MLIILAFLYMLATPITVLSSNSTIVDIKNMTELLKTNDISRTYIFSDLPLNGSIQIVESSPKDSKEGFTPYLINFGVAIISALLTFYFTTYQEKRKEKKKDIEEKKFLKLIKKLISLELCSYKKTFDSINTYKIKINDEDSDNINDYKLKLSDYLNSLSEIEKIPNSYNSLSAETRVKMFSSEELHQIETTYIILKKFISDIKQSRELNKSVSEGANFKFSDLENCIKELKKTIEMTQHNGEFQNDKMN